MRLGLSPRGPGRNTASVPGDEGGVVRRRALTLRAAVACVGSPTRVAVGTAEETNTEGR